MLLTPLWVKYMRQETDVTDVQYSYKKEPTERFPQQGADELLAEI